ncbi:peptidoglycan/LPS O-acetylase OafA/YrhL [Antricoccus suffuscus]|uniref:Peptidoglycan/LPS O-acetylase OafA/YrhL n=1 Tax=Antricoccus suffuscus TaxID=1629062 RepID=A0A2T1A6Z0_9ACTN|nr:acyltransferase [Antricoccus suffuscus]PRZ44369.1 peptidoglycan/LPS O-acetylase OafA/YrhL [Antricoccus suffuscus]
MPLTIRQAFNPKSNSIGFLRWLMAFAVIFSHAGPLAGFYGGHDLGLQFTTEQSLGGVAVCGFFFLSGFLITKSRQGSSTIFRYFWRRILRIFPAFWAALLVTAFVLGPIAYIHTYGSATNYWSPTVDSPFRYFTDNMFLRMNQPNIAGMGSTIPLGHAGGFNWNGSAWTLIYEFKGYAIIGIFGLLGILKFRWLVATFAGFMVVLNTMTWAGFGDFTKFAPFLNDYKNIMVLMPFAVGMVFALFDDVIRIDDRIAVAALALAAFTYFSGAGWLLYGQFGFVYVLMWCAIRIPLTRWDVHADLSYGIYIFAWPIMQFSAYFGLQKAGWWVYHICIVAAIHLVAFASWHLIEKRAMSLKSWTPSLLAAAQKKAGPLNDKIKRSLVNPNFSSSRYAQKLRDIDNQLTTSVGQAPSAISGDSQPNQTRRSAGSTDRA